MKLIVNYGVGFDYIEVEEVYECGIMVLNMSGVVIEDIVDMIMVLILVVC